MSARWIVVDISARTVRCYSVDQAGKTTEKRLLGQLELKEGESSGDLGDRMAELLGGVSLKEYRVYTMLPGSRGYYRLLDFPFGAAKIKKVLSFEMGQRLPVPAADLAFGFVSFGKYGNLNRVLGAAIPQPVGAYWLEALQRAGLDPWVMDIAGCAQACLWKRYLADIPVGAWIHIRDGEACVLCWTDGVIREAFVVPLKNEGVGEQAASLVERLAGRWELDQVFISGHDNLGPELADGLADRITARVQALEQVPPGAEWAGSVQGEDPLGAAVVRGRPGCSFRHGAWARKKAYGGGARVAIHAAACLILGLLIVLAGRGSLLLEKGKMVDRLDSEVSDLFERVLPGKAARYRPSQYVSILSARLGDIVGAEGDEPEAGPRLVDALMRISRLVPSGLNVRFENFSWDAGGIRIQGGASSFKSVDKLSAVLKDAGGIRDVRIREAKAAPDGQGVRFRLELHFEGGA